MTLIDDAGARSALPEDWVTPDAALSGGDGLAVALPNDADPAALAPAFARIRLIAVPFPKFADGRAFSVARRLRALGYAGRLRATGSPIPDHYAFARDCGFDEVEIDDALHARQGPGAWLSATAPRAAPPPFDARRAARA
jgi:uncharacterized protein (DUF934 family)